MNIDTNIIKVLIVEDDKGIREALRYNLIAENYSVKYEEDGISAIDTILSEDFDIILLDIMLPGLDGLEVCKRIRYENVDTPVIILTAKETEIDKVLGLELGADDYVSKPFSMPELLARIKSNLRRNKLVKDKNRISSKKLFTHLGIDIDLDKLAPDIKFVLVAISCYKEGTVSSIESFQKE